MKVQIKKCSGPNFWYSDPSFIDSINEVEDTLNLYGGYEWNFKVKNSNKVISACDAIIINEKSDDSLKDISTKLADLAKEVSELAMRLAKLAPILIFVSLLLASCASTTHQPRRVANNTTYPKF